MTGRDNEPPRPIPASGPITIALGGDVLLSRPLGAAERDAGFIELGHLVRGAHFAVANLEMNLLGREEALQAEARAMPRWPFGSGREASVLEALGIDALTLANDHATDYGTDGLTSTIRVLDAARLLHAGTGGDLPAARAAVLAGGAVSPPGRANASVGRIALISVAASSLPESRATAPRPDIAGRPGLSPLRYAADITVDAATFQTLKGSLAVLNAGPPASDRALTMFGTPIKRGDRTTVEFFVDESDERQVLEVIGAARQAVDIVVVAVHSHEPA